MSFPRYPRYKDSGVEWLGEVPEHWDIVPCRAIVDEQTAKNDDSECEDYLSLMANVGVIPYAEKGDIGNRKPEDLSKCKLVRNGDFVINSMNYGIGSYGVSRYDGVCSPVYIVMRPKDQIVEPGFAFRIFEDKGFQTYAQSFGNGILEHRCAINWDVLKVIGLAVPPHSEQRVLLEFLDRETGKIDALVAEQRRLIELLQEKRQAVISHAVTKGLNPDVPLKPSGIEWLGDVPEHWEVSKIKFVACGFMYGTSADCNSDETGTPVLRIPNIKDGFIDFTDLKFANFPTDEEAKYLVNSGDILVVRTNGNPDLVGKSALFHGGERCMFASYLIKISPRPNVIPEYLNLVMNADCTRDMLTLSARTSAGNYNMNCGGLGQTPIVLPANREQIQILEFLGTRLEKNAALIAEAERAIDLLQERRTALISAAVTGKIDVRGLVETEAA